ncbi:MAG: hypothetical protein JXA03_08410 [Bacteroidales bacterium]|nr:hypothetical protein [Bacteroidales bacterium]
MKKQLFYSLIVVFLGISVIAQDNALDFDGSNDYVNVGPQAGLVMSATLTIEAWVFPEGAGSGGAQGGIIVNKEGEYEIARFANGYVGWAFANVNPGWFWHETPAFLPLNQWSHVAVTYQSGIAKTYLNGELVETYNGSGNIGDINGSTNDFRIGGRQALSHYFNGRIDDVEIWNIVRTESQIRENVYREHPSPATEAGLVAYYKFNETSGTNVTDHSASGFNGTMINMDPATDRVASTAPNPYESIAFGFWQNNATWNTGQLAPVHPWARVNIKSGVTVDSQEEALEVVIDAGQTLTIEPASSLTVSGDMINNAGAAGLVLQSDAGGNGSLIEYSGAEATVQRYFSGNDPAWHLTGSPVTGALSEVFTGMYLQEYDETTGLYTEIIPTNVPLIPMKGYAVYSNLSAFNTVTFTGNLNTGAVTASLTAVNPYGWNLLSNPYASSIDWDAVTLPSGVNNAVYYLEASTGNFLSYNGGLGGGSRYIPPMQGFFVSANASATMVFDNTVRTHTGANNFYKSELTNYLVIKAEGNGFSDRTYIRFDAGATPDFDGQSDAYKIIAGDNDDLPQIYTQAGAENLSINVLPDQTSVNLGFEAGVSGIYTLSLDEIEDIGTVTLEDLTDGTLTDLNAGNYSFSYESGDDPYRFVLHFAPLSLSGKTTAGLVKVYSAEKDINVNIPENITGEVSVFSITGQLITTAPFSGSGIQKIAMDGRSGHFIVRVVSDRQAFSEKVFVR